MVAFNPALSGNEQNFLSYSKGTPPNRAFETLFEGIGSSYSGAVKIADEDTKGDIEADVYEAYDAANDSFGVPDGAVQGTAAMGAPGKQPLPNELTTSTNRLERMAAARDAGTLKESHFWGMLETDVRRLRQKYPGYRGEIDSIVSSITGSTPANALRSSLLNEWDAAAREARGAGDKFDTYVRANANFLSDELMQRYLNGERDSQLQAEITWDISRRQKHQTDLTISHSEMTHAQTKDALDTETALERARTEVGDFITEQMFTVGKGVGKDFFAKAKEYGEGGYNDEEIAQLVGMYNQIYAQWKPEVENILNQDWTDGSGNSYADVLDDKQRADVMALFDERMNTIKELLTTDKVGILAMTATINDAAVNTATQDILKSDKRFATITALSRMGALEPFNAFLIDQPQFKATFMGLLNAMAIGDVVTGEKGSAAEVIDEAAKSGVKDAQFYQTTIQNFQDLILKSDEWGTEATKNTVEALFGIKNNDFLLKFKEGNRMPIFTTLTSPQVTAKMAEIAKTDPESFNKYERWVRTNFNVLFKEHAGELQQTFENKQAGATVVYNFETNEFIPSFKPSAEDIVSGAADATELKIRDELKDLNKYLKVADPIWTAKGQDRTTEVQKLLGSLGIDFNLDAETKEDRDTSHAKTAFKQQDTGNIELAFDQDAQLRDALGLAEGAGYNTVYGGGTIDLTGQTVQAALDYQTGKGTHPVGKYQIVKTTLQSLVDDGTLDADEVFDEEAQDRAAMALLRRRGYDKYKAGKLSKEGFLLQLAQEWASVPKDATSMMSYYAGDGTHGKVREAGQAIANLIMQ